MSNFYVGTLLCTSTLLLSCIGKIQTAKTKGLDLEKSNIEVRDSKNRLVEEFQFISNLGVPKGIVVALETRATVSDSPNLFANDAYVLELYQIIRSINQGDNLKGLEGPSQEITLTVVVQNDLVKNEFQKKLNQTLKLPEGKSPPYLQFMIQPKMRDLWVQDWVEFGTAKLKGDDKRWLVIVDNHRLPASMYSDLQDLLKIPIVSLVGSEFIPTGGSEYVLADSPLYGGNLDAAPGNRFIYGNNLTDYYPDTLERIKGLGNKNGIEVPTDWLQVGHVDEFMTFIPSNDKCGYSLLFGSPLEGLSLLMSSSQTEEDIGLYIKKSKLRVAFKNYLIDSSNPGPYELKDFDLEKQVEWSSESNFILKNLGAMKNIQAAIESIKGSGLACLQDIVPIPAFFEPKPDGGVSAPEKAVSYFGNMQNLVVLRDHLVVPLPKRDRSHTILKSFQDAFIAKVASRIGGLEKIHFIDASDYHTRRGAAHCSTQVIREPELNFTSKN